MITRKRWEAGINPVEMLESLWQRVTACGRHPERDRKVRLYHVGLARQHWDELPWIGRVITELAERKVDGEFDESVLRQPLEYIAEGVYLYAEYVCDHHLSGSHHPEPMLGISDYEKYLLEVGNQKPSDAPDWATNGDFERMFNLACIVYFYCVRHVRCSDRRGGKRLCRFQW